MKLYGVRYKGDTELLAVSDSLDIIRHYISPFVDSGMQFEIGRIKNGSLSEPEIYDLTLVPVGLQFIPRKYTDAYELFTGQNFRDLITAFNVLEGIYVQGGLNRFDEESLSQTLRILYSKMQDLRKECLSPKNMVELQNMLDEWKGKLGIDDQ